MTPEKERELAALEAEAGGGGPMVPPTLPKGTVLPSAQEKVSGMLTSARGLMESLSPFVQGLLSIDPSGMPLDTQTSPAGREARKAVAGTVLDAPFDPATYTAGAAAAVPVVGPFLVPPVVAGTRVTQDVLAGRKPDWWNAGLTGALAATPGAAVQGPRLLKNLWQRTVPGSFAKAEGRRLAAHEAGETTRRTTQAAADATARQAVAQRNLTGQAAEAAELETTKQRALALTQPKGTAKALYAAADEAADTAAPLTAIPATQKAIQRLKTELPEKHTLRPIIEELEAGLSTPGGVPVRQLWGTLREIAGKRAAGASYLYGAIATDLRAHPAGETIMTAAKAFREDVGRELAGKVVRGAGPVEAPLDVKKLAGGFEKSRQGLGDRLPPDEMQALERLIGAEQTRPKFTPEPVPKPTKFQPTPFTSGTLEGPGTATNFERLMYLILGGGGMYYGSPKAALAAATAIPAARLVPPAWRAYRATLPPPWWRAGMAAPMPSAMPPPESR